MNKLSDIFKCLIIMIDTVETKKLDVGIHKEQLDECLKVCLCLLKQIDKEEVTST